MSSISNITGALECCGCSGGEGPLKQTWDIYMDFMNTWLLFFHLHLASSSVELALAVIDILYLVKYFAHAKLNVRAENDVWKISFTFMNSVVSIQDILMNLLFFKRIIMKVWIPTQYLCCLCNWRLLHEFHVGPY